MSNILRQSIPIVIEHKGGQVQRLTRLVLKRPMIRWLATDYRGDPMKWCKTRHVTISTVTLDRNGMVGGPFIETMAFPGHGTRVFHPMGSGVEFYQSRLYPEKLGWDTQKMLKGIRDQEARCIRKVAQGRRY